MIRNFFIFTALLFVTYLFNYQNVYGNPENRDCTSYTASPKQSGTETKFIKGYCDFMNGDYKKALVELDQLETRIPILDDYIIYFRGSSYDKLNDTDKAASEYSKILISKNSSILYTDALAGMANIYNRKGKYAEAIRTFRELTRLDSSKWLQSRYKNNIAEIYEKTGRTSEALSIYKDIWVNYPQTNYSEKITEISKKHGIKFIPTKQEIRERADVFFNLSLWDDALREYLRLPQSDEVRTKIALCLYYTKKQDQALSILNEINSSESNFWKGKILEKNNFTKEASKSYYSSYLFFPSGKYADQSLMLSAELDKNDKDYEQALSKYRLLLKNYPSSRYRLDAAWNIGWIYYLQGNYIKAAKSFSEYSYSESSLDYKRFQYWKAKSLEKEGNKEHAYEIYKSIAYSNMYSYHAFLSRLKIGHKPIEETVKSSDGAISQNSSRKKVEMLIHLGLNSFAAKENDKLRSEASSPGDLIYVSSVYYRLGDYYSTVATVEQNKNPKTLFYSYPRAFSSQVEEYSDKYSLDDLLVYSLMREESRFNTEAVSGSGARGLMQLLPDTAVEAAGKAGVYPFSLDMLYKPDINVELGTFYMREMLNRFNGNIPVALAGYNAGPNRIAQLLENIDYKGFDEFVEKIPIFETRNYVKKILKSYGAYRAMYGYSQKN